MRAASARWHPLGESGRDAERPGSVARARRSSARRRSRSTAPSAEFWKVAAMPAPAPRWSARQAVHDAGLVGRDEEAHRQARSGDQQREQQIGEVDGQELEQQEAERRRPHPAGRERARAEAVGETARRTGPAIRNPTAGAACRCRPTAACRRSCSRASGSQIPCSQMISMNIRPPRPSAGQQRGDVPGGEGADPEQPQAEHRLLDPGLDDAKTPGGRARRRSRRSPSGRPPHRVTAVGLDAVRDADHDRDQADREGDVAHQSILRRLADAAVPSFM